MPAITMVGMTDERHVPVSGADPAHPGSLKAFTTIRLLTGGYLALSALTLMVIALRHDDATMVNSAVWVRGVIVTVSAAFTYAFAVRAARGSRGAYRRLRVIAAVMVVAIVVIIALPGTFPVWMKLEQAVCGLLLLGVVATAFGRRLRSVFAGA
ncbi:membrane protein [Microbispora sp. ATCC PTA-5024]|nr:membrane protein [Microbispora sp. ATCC PTA-5024]